ncbi:MAG: F0F1 ATP synthase subunit B [Alphaproteobacteria bacterium]|nr:F0F1 ATP synthase subunit B [Alphaproteobacteria bacterium]
MAEKSHTTGTAGAQGAQDPHSAAAAGAHDVTTSTGARGDAHGGSTFPPFNSETFAPQLVWLVLTFTLLYVLMSRLVLPRIGEIIDERRERIQRDLDTAERLKTDTDKAIANYEKAFADARANAGSIARETREKLDQKVSARQAAADADNSAQIAAAEKSIQETRSKALANVNEIAAEVAGAVIKQLINTDVPASDIRAALPGRAS